MVKNFKNLKQSIKSKLEPLIHGVLNRIDIFRNQNFRIKNIKNFNNQINSITIDTTNYASELCKIGGNFGTDKSIFSTKTPFKHSYTAIYNILFSHLKYEKINFAEIGILDNSSILMWRNFFSKANIDGFEYDINLINNAKKNLLSNTNYYEIDVKNKQSIIKAFRKANKVYDIIIDDSTHLFDDQINIISTVKDFLKPGGYLIIEDIFSKKIKYKEKNFFEAIKNMISEFNDIFFINCNHHRNYGGIWYNHKLLVLVKK